MSIPMPAPAGVVPAAPAGAHEAAATGVQHARIRLARYLRPTPVREGFETAATASRLWYKCDHLRPTGSFKERGVLNALLTLTPEEVRGGVIAPSAGNHGVALAYWGKKLKIPVTVVMPIAAPLAKIQLCRGLGAEVVLQGRNFADARLEAERRGAERRMVHINGSDHKEVIAGAGTAGLEILEQIPEVDLILVPVGGGGLVAGIGAAVKRLNPRVKVIGVESERCPSMSNALRAGRPVFTPVGVGGTIADALSVSTIGPNALNIVRECVDDVITTSESSIALAFLHLLEQEKLLVEGGGCAGLAALLSGKFEAAFKGKNVCVVLSGGNVDMTVLGRIIERGLHCSGRMLQFDVAVSDRVGGLAYFMSCLAKTGASVKNVTQEHPFISDWGVVAVHVTVETMNLRHAKTVIQQMTDIGFKLKVVDEKKYSDVNASKL